MTKFTCSFSAQYEFNTPACSLQMSLMKLPPPPNPFYVKSQARAG